MKLLHKTLLSILIIDKKRGFSQDNKKELLHNKSSFDCGGKRGIRTFIVTNCLCWIILLFFYFLPTILPTIGKVAPF